jgi:Flp pilus assembly protein TadG
MLARLRRAIGLDPYRARVFGGAVRLARRDRGSIIVLSLFLFLGILMVAGLAVDFAHFEERRTRMQATLDSAVLAAADINQALEPTDVVNDYFERAGLDDSPVNVSVNEGLNFRSVKATTRVTVPTMFVRLVDVDQFSSPAGSTAEENIGNVEISLVLDVSGSMGDTGAGSSDTKIQLLRVAAGEFVDTMFDSIQAPGLPAGKLSMSLVPYNQQVALGSDLGSDFNFTTEHNKSHCADFTSADFSSAGISPTQLLKRTAHGDFRYSYSPPYFIECQQQADHDVLALGNSRSTLKTRINQLQDGGDTAIDIGMKWGVALLDPALRPLVDTRISEGKTDAALAGRPFDYGLDDALKVVVVMTDGQNTNTYAIRDQYKSGPSSLVKGKDNKYYYYYPPRSGTSDFYDTSANRWRSLSYIGGSYTVLDYADVWSLMSVPYFSTNYVKEATGSSSFASNAITKTSYGDKDDQLLAVCNAAKQQGVVVFAIGFEAPNEGRAVLQDCATADAYYYDAEGTTISDAFAGIASAINALRLTQ